MSSLLQKVELPSDIRAFSIAQLEALCHELRTFIQATTKTKEGHIKASLGVTELTVALHYFFNTPHDILVWDVGHQAYVHKVLTGRKNQFASNRQKNGLAGFTLSAESVYDPFGAGHSSTSISAIAGFWKADQLSGNERHRIAVIGDGGLTGGMAFEAMNYLGEQKANCWVFLNDNQRSIDKNIGALQHYDSYSYFSESLGFVHYEADGHSISDLLEVMNRLSEFKGPKFIRVVTEKGKGYAGHSAAAQSEAPTFQQAFGSSITNLLKKHEDLVVISPAMLSGARLLEAQKQFPDRVIDVGIAEQHAVTMAAALAAAGKKVICHLYSTFAQRAADQIIHDVALQNLPVIFALDRAGLVGEDGATHHGVFDVSLFSGIPNLAMAAPLTGNDLDFQMQCFLEKKQAALIRYPKSAFRQESEPRLQLKPRCMKEGRNKCVVSYGAIAAEAQEAIDKTDFAHFNIPQLQPFPATEVSAMLENFSLVVSVEENTTAGGLGEKLSALKANDKLNAKLEKLCVPHRFIAHGKRQELLEECRLSAGSIRSLLRN